MPLLLLLLVLAVGVPVSVAVAVDDAVVVAVAVSVDVAASVAVAAAAAVAVLPKEKLTQESCLWESHWKPSGCPMGYGDSYRVPHGGPCGGPTGIPVGFLRDSHGDTTGCLWHSHGPLGIIQILGLARIFEYPGRVGSAWNNTNIGLGLNIRIPWACGSPPG